MGTECHYLSFSYRKRCLRLCLPLNSAERASLPIGLHCSPTGLPTSAVLWFQQTRNLFHQHGWVGSCTACPWRLHSQKPFRDCNFLQVTLLSIISATLSDEKGKRRERRQEKPSVGQRGGWEYQKRSHRQSRTAPVSLPCSSLLTLKFRCWRENR